VPKKPKSRGSSSASAPAPAPVRKRPGRSYEPPKLMKFEKLERLIVSGE
jgi:hypothetical protein